MTKEEIAQSIKVQALAGMPLSPRARAHLKGKPSHRATHLSTVSPARSTLDETEAEAFNDHIEVYFLRLKP